MNTLKLAFLLVATVLGLGSCRMMRSDNVDDMGPGCIQARSFRKILRRPTLIILNDSSLDCVTVCKRSVSGKTAMHCDCLCDNLDIADCLSDLTPMTLKEINTTLLRNTSSLSECQLVCEYWATGHRASNKRDGCCCICESIHSQPLAIDNTCTALDVPADSDCAYRGGMVPPKCDCSQGDMFSTAKCLREIRINALEYHTLLRSANIDECKQRCSESPQEHPHGSHGHTQGDHENVACCCVCNWILFNIERPLEMVTTTAATNPPRSPQTTVKTTVSSLATPIQTTTTEKTVTAAPNTASTSATPTTKTVTTDSDIIIMVKSTTKPTVKSTEEMVTEETTTEETTTEETTTEETTTEETTTEEITTTEATTTEATTTELEEPVY